MPTILRWVLRLGPTNPIAVRLVQNGSKRTKHLYIRGAYLAALILMLLWFMLMAGGGGGGQVSYRDLAAQGSQTFMYAAYLQIGLICILAPVFMAGAIAQEANPQTWEILLVSPLTRAEIVLGNLFGRLFFILALLFASLPLFALTQYFGGVPGSSIFISYLIAGCAAILVGSCAIALSVSRLVGKRAVFTFYVSVVGYLAVTFALDRWMVTAGLGVGGKGVTWMTGINPFLALHALLNPTNYPSAPAGSLTGAAAWFFERPIATWCWLSTILSITLVMLSMLTARSGGLQTIATGTSGIPLHRRLLRMGAKTENHRAPRHVWSNPIAWREAAARNGTAGRIFARWSFIAIGGGFGVLLVLLYALGKFTGPAGFQLALQSTVWGELAVITLVGINMAATAISREREDGTLDLLLTTPITQKQYITGKLRGLIAYLLPMIAIPVGTLTLAGLYALFGDAIGGKGATSITKAVGSGGNVTLPIVLPEAGIIATLVIFPFMAFAVMVGLKWSLQSKGTISSVITTVGVVGVISGIVGLCAFQAGDSMNTLGASLSAASPASAVFSIVNPRRGLGTTISDSGLTTARVGLLVGACLSALVYIFIVAALRKHMEATFDITTRKLAGAT